MLSVPYKVAIADFCRCSDVSTLAHPCLVESCCWPTMYVSSSHAEGCTPLVCPAGAVPTPAWILRVEQQAPSSQLPPLATPAPGAWRTCWLLRRTKWQQSEPWACACYTSSPACTRLWHRLAAVCWEGSFKLQCIESSSTLLQDLPHETKLWLTPHGILRCWVCVLHCLCLTG